MKMGGVKSDQFSWKKDKEECKNRRSEKTLPVIKFLLRPREKAGHIETRHTT